MREAVSKGLWLSPAARSRPAVADVAGGAVVVPPASRGGLFPLQRRGGGGGGCVLAAGMERSAGPPPRPQSRQRGGGEGALCRTGGWARGRLRGRGAPGRGPAPGRPQLKMAAAASPHLRASSSSRAGGRGEPRRRSARRYAEASLLPSPGRGVTR